MVTLFELKELLDKLASPFYRLRGRLAWTPGYYTAKKEAICRAIDSNLMASGEPLPAGYGCRIDERVVEYPWLFARLPRRPGTMLDAGSALNHRFLVERAPLKDAQLSIMTLAPEKRCYWRRSISYVYGDLRHTQFADATFDVIASISTIEHIGFDNTMLYTDDASKNETDDLGFMPAVKEFKRILKPGGTCLITVPFGRRRLHGWYQVFDDVLLSRVVEAFQPSRHNVEFFGYTPDGWHRAAPEDLVNAEFFDVHAGKPFATDFAAGARGVACLSLTA